MFNIIWDTKQYFFWLILVSVFCFLLERICTWRRNQKVFRKEIGQDFFFLIFNGHYAGILVASVLAYYILVINDLFIHLNVQTPAAIRLIVSYPLVTQFLIYLILQDFLAWGTHFMLHRVPFLWQFHKLHHSIRELDWIGNFRFHWMEIIVYQTINFPLIMLGVDGRVILWIAITTTLIGHLNHANIKTDYGFMRYIFNSPRLHVWHHDFIPVQKYGVNFGVIFSFWDWMFGTVYFPADRDQPALLGFEGIEKFPRPLWKRLIYPVLRKKE